MVSNITLFETASIYLYTQNPAETMANEDDGTFLEDEKHVS